MILNLICPSIYLIIKGLVCYWMWNEEYRGSLLIEQFARKYFEQYYGLVAGKAGKYLAYLGFPERKIEEEVSKDKVE